MITFIIVLKMNTNNFYNIMSLQSIINKEKRKKGSKIKVLGAKKLVSFSILPLHVSELNGITSEIYY